MKILTLLYPLLAFYLKNGFIFSQRVLNIMQFRASFWHICGMMRTSWQMDDPSLTLPPVPSTVFAHY